jgi:aspartate aminotransferase
MIPDELAPLIAPLEALESIRRSVVRLGDRLCDLSYANPYAGVQEGARAAIRAALDQERLLDLQYTPFGGQTLARRAAADALRASHELPFSYRHVVLTPGAMAALHVSLHACGQPGDEVVIPTPCWLDYPLYVRVTGRSPVEVPLAGDRFDLDLEAIAAAFSERTCAVLLSTPANPTGRCYDAATIEALAGIVRAAEQRLGCTITIIADETHRDFIDAQQFHSLAGAFDRTVLVYSFGKYHFLQGQRLGYVAVSPEHPHHEELAKEMVQWTRVLGLATPTALMQRALPALLELRHDLSWLDQTRHWLTAELTAQGYRVVPADGTLFMYVRTPEGHDDMEFARLLAHQGVLVLPAPVFHHRGYFRLALTASNAMLSRAVQTFARVAGHPDVEAAPAGAWTSR